MDLSLRSKLIHIHHVQPLDDDIAFNYYEKLKEWIKLNEDEIIRYSVHTDDIVTDVEIKHSSQDINFDVIGKELSRFFDVEIEVDMYMYMMQDCYKRFRLRVFTPKPSFEHESSTITSIF